MKHFKTPVSFIFGILVGATLFGGTAALAAGILAEPSTQTFFVDGKQIQMEAYAIGGNNYVKLRDICAAVDFNVVYDGDTDSVWIDSTHPYVLPTADNPMIPTQTSVPDGSGKVSKTPFTEKLLTGDSRAREDFSGQANASIFDEVYTRAAYNAIRQSMVDRSTIMDGNNPEGFNPNYAYAYTTATAETRQAMSVYVVSRLSTEYSYRTSVEPYLKEYYKYPDYFICTAFQPPSHREALTATDTFIASISALNDADKVRRMNDLVCDKLTYKATASPSLSTIFASTSPVPGKCVNYAHAIKFLCDRAGVPCIILVSDNHNWNMVYVNGKWLHVDATGSDLGDELDHRESSLMLTAFPDYDKIHIDISPKATAFAQELLVPGSTK